MPVKRKLTNKVKVLNKEFNLVKKDDGGKNLDSYKYELVKENKTSGEGAGVEESKEKSKEESKSEESKNDDSYPHDEFVRLTTKMFPKWSRENCRMGDFLREIDPTKIYQERELIDLCNKHQKKLSLLTSKINIKYIFIFKKNNDNTYQLQPVLVEAYNKYF